MSPSWGQVVGIATVLALVAFVATWVWAWLPHHARRFERLSRLPMHDAKDPP